MMEFQKNLFHCSTRRLTTLSMASSLLEEIHFSLNLMRRALIVMFQYIPMIVTLLGMKWRAKCFTDLALFFLAYAQLHTSSRPLQIVLSGFSHNCGINFLLHYLDRVHTLGPPNSPVCQINVNTCVKLFSEWGIPLHPHKLEGPSTCLTILGIKRDSMTLQVHLPQNKFDRIATLLESWSLKTALHMERVGISYWPSPTRL